ATGWTCFGPAEFLSEPPAWRRELLLGAQQLDQQPWDCVDTQGWYVAALGVPPYDEPRTQAALAVAACNQFAPRQVVLLERPRPPWLHVGDTPDYDWQRAFYGCDAIRRHAHANLLGSRPR